MIWLLLILTEVVVGVRMFSAAPTDTVRTWYPTVWSYIGEHGIISTVVWLIVVGLFRVFGKRLLSTSKGLDWTLYLTALGIGLSVDFGASIYLWFVAPMVGTRPHIWYTASPWPYLSMRGITWALAYIVCLFILQIGGRFSGRSPAKRVEP